MNRIPQEEFIKNKTWIQCNCCLKSISSNITFLVLSCSDILCAQCANKYKGPGPTPEIKCPKCAVFQKWKTITPNLEPHVLQNFEPVADTDVVRISKYQWSHCNMNVERMMKKNNNKRDAGNNLRKKVNHIKEELDKTIKWNDNAEEKFTKIIPPAIFSKIMKMSLEDIEMLDIADVIPRRNSMPDLHNMSGHHAVPGSPRQYRYIDAARPSCPAPMQPVHNSRSGYYHQTESSPQTEPFFNRRTYATQRMNPQVHSEPLTSVRRSSPERRSLPTMVWKHPPLSQSTSSASPTSTIPLIKQVHMRQMFPSTSPNALFYTKRPSPPLTASKRFEPAALHGNRNTRPTYDDSHHNNGQFRYESHQDRYPPKNMLPYMNSNI